MQEREAQDPLIDAVLAEDVGRVAEVLSRGHTGDLPQAMAIAASRNNIHLIRLLLGTGVDLNRPNGYLDGGRREFPALFHALQCGHIAAAAVLLEAGARVALISGMGNTLWSELVHYNAPNSAHEFMLHAGADINSAGESGYTPLVSALDQNRPRHVDWLLRHGADPTTCRDVLWGVVLEGNLVGYLRCLVQAGLDLSLPWPHATPGYTVLEIAAEHNCPEIFDYVAHYVAPGELVERDIHLAASGGRLAAVVRLLAEGVAVEVPDRHGRTPLAMAVLSRRTNVVSLLLKAGVDPNQRLHYDWVKPYRERLENLAGSGEYYDGWPLVMVADAKKDPVSLCLLLDAGADPDSTVGPTGNQMTIKCADGCALHLACAAGDDEAVDLLLMAGADPNGRVGDGPTPLEVTAGKYGEWIVRSLISFGADARASHGSDRDAAQIAVVNDRGNVLAELLAHDRELSSWRDEAGKTLLMYASENDSIACVRELLRSRADAALKDIHGRTAIDYVV